MKQKAAEARPARDLYLSPLFAGRRRVVELSCDRWLILSDLHGVVEPSTVLEPYDVSLDTASVLQRRLWSRRVLKQLVAIVGPLEGHTFEVHAGSTYWNHGLADGLTTAGATVEMPARGLKLGQQLAFYAGTMLAGGRAPVTLNGYHRLRLYLEQASSPVTLTFVEMERIMDRSLPPSARKHRPWWANHGGSTQARQWLAAGWQVDLVDLANERVRFVR